MTENETTTPETDTTSNIDPIAIAVVATAVCAGGYVASKKIVRKMRARTRGLAGVYLITTMK